MTDEKLVRFDNFRPVSPGYTEYVLQAFRGIWPGSREFEQQGERDDDKADPRRRQ